MHGGHAHHHHDHGHGGHGHAARPFGVALLINFAFVLVETAAGFAANSTALLADAGHNLSDVLGLGLAGGAAWLATRAASPRRTYGYGKAGVAAALANALLLVAAAGAIGWEAVRRLSEPQAVAPLIVMAAAAAGILVNGGTALMFARARRSDLNARGAYLHLMADAAVSAGVIAAGALTWATGAAWIDPAASLVVVGIIVWGSWGLLRESLDLILDAAPAGIDVAAVRERLGALPGVTEVHDLHVWAMTASEPALTAHLVRPDGADDAFLDAAETDLRAAFGIRHVTLQVERGPRGPCAHAHA
ncbi:MAG: cation diffusion facilitator family transporter [Hyphomonadaceae bacterium]|nr:cation diffusion facilitator family transporter [Hyphomonadaceae bacterium]